jgi:hypothetical protein
LPNDGGSAGRALGSTGLSPNVEKHFERMMDRSAVREALEDEGL